MADAWRAICAELRRVVGESIYEIWLGPLTAIELCGNVLVLEAPAATLSWVADRYGRLLETAAAGVVGRPVKIVYGSEPGRAGIRVEGARRGGKSDSGDDDLRAGALNPRYSFDQFIIGDGNRFAHAAALVVAEMPGQAYNPLFLHAPPGLGKTHLLHAIGNYVTAYGGSTKVRYTTAESFTNHFINALHSRSLDRFKHAYRDADVLLVDDVQFLASKAKTEEEFFYTFNALYETGRQLVLTCDRLPRELPSVEERLRERFESGLVADIAAPDLATRVAILRKRAALDRITLAEPIVLEMIAARVSTNVRTLEGALIRVVAYGSLTRRPIDPELTEIVLDAMYPQTARPAISITAIQSSVARHFGVSVDELNSQSRIPRIAWPRQIAMHLARELTPESLPAIGRAFGGRNHATVHHALRRVSNRLTLDPEASAAVSELSRTLSGHQRDRND
ncbi:MAG: chromosomal replication initiator protein DnaA [Actinomycetota bacterium]|nr:chromosomal replication initiator protein DnaA [Actinomycetota bacterium]